LDHPTTRFMAEQGWILRSRLGSVYFQILDIEILDPRTSCRRKWQTC
jgi:hypothetical protein